MTDKSERQLHLRVTAGPTYSPSTHQLVPINTSTPLTLSTPHITTSLHLRIQNYRGLPTSSPTTSPYFSHASHKSDLYSIAFSFVLHDADIPATDLVFGNDFEKPIRDKLPTGFGAAYRLLRWAIDPGLEGDVYAEHPYLYGPLVSSINVLRVGPKDGDLQEKKHSEGQEGDEVITEGADGEDAQEIRRRMGIPDDGARRMKFFLNKAHKEAFVFEKGRRYECDFFNGYLDFNDLALKLPGITMKLVDFWDGQPLRYVLKHRNAAKGIDQELFVITFTLIPEEELEAEKEKWETKGKEETQKDGEKKDDVKEKQAFQDDDVD